MKRSEALIICTAITAVSVAFDIVSGVQPAPLSPVPLGWVAHLFLWMSVGWILRVVWQKHVSALKITHGIDAGEERDS